MRPCLKLLFGVSLLAAALTQGCSRSLLYEPTDSAPPASQAAGVPGADVPPAAGSGCWPDACDKPSAPESGAQLIKCDLPVEPLTARAGESCYELRLPQGNLRSRMVPFGASDSYTRVYHDVPWPAGAVATRFGLRRGMGPTLHHVELFESDSQLPDGTLLGGPGDGDPRRRDDLITSWKIGRCTTELPAGVGQRLPEPGRQLLVEWHHFNDSRTETFTESAVQVCTVPAGARPLLADMVKLDTTAMGSRSLGRCRNRSGKPVTFLAVWPRAGGSNISLRARRLGNDTPFLEDINGVGLADQRELRPSLVLMPDDVVQTTCSASTPFESCFHLALAYPARALGTPTTGLLRECLEPD